jgi:hypothetical protein
MYYEGMLITGRNADIDAGGQFDISIGLHRSGRKPCNVLCNPMLSGGHRDHQA